MRKVEYKYIFLFALLLGLSLFVLFFPKYALFPLKCLFSWEPLILCLSAIVFCITIIHKIRFKEYTFSRVDSLASIRNSLKEMLDTILEPSIFVCAVSILKGLFLDYFYSEQFFQKFNNAEKSFLLITAGSFLITTTIELKRTAVELFTSNAVVEDEGENVEILDMDDNTESNN